MSARYPHQPGEKWGRLTVLDEAGSVSGKRHLLCRCECGTERAFIAAQLRSGMTKSCGCLSRDLTIERSTKHGHHPAEGPSPTRISWLNMIARCTRETCPDWPLYGARGIRVCPRWLVFEYFLEDMGERPAGLSLDRIDNDGSYEPGNCRWATPHEQRVNQRPKKRRQEARERMQEAFKEVVA